MYKPKRTGNRSRAKVPATDFSALLCLALMFLSLASSTGLRAQTKAADVPKLVQDLNDKDPAVRGAAATALDNLHDPAAEPALIAALKQNSDNVPSARVLARALSQFRDANAVAAIAALLPGKAGHIAAAQLLQMDQPGQQAAADATASEDKNTLAAVGDSFLDAPEAGLAVLPGTLKNSKSAAQRSVIVLLLADCAIQNPWYENPPRPAFTQGFLPAASDANPDVRMAVASAIQKLAETQKLEEPGMGHPDFGLQEALPVLQTLAADKDVDVRATAMDALGSLANADAVAILKKHLNDPNETVKQHATQALAAAEAAMPGPIVVGNAEPKTKSSATDRAAAKTTETRELTQINLWNDQVDIPQLIVLLSDPSSLVRAAAADKLGKLDYRNTAMNGADHEQDLSEVPQLIATLQDSHALVRTAAAEALGAIGHTSAVPGLIGLLKDPKPKVVVAAADALGSMVAGHGYAADVLSADDHTAASSALVELLASNDQEVRHSAISALSTVATVDDLKHVIPLLGDSDRFVRNQAATTLAHAFYPNPNVERDAKLDAFEKAAGPGLVALLSMPDSRSAAIQALVAMKTPPAAAAHPLIETLKYNVWIVADGMSRPEIPSNPFNGFQGLDINLAIDVLTKTGSLDAEPLLVKFLNTINPEAAQHACAGLAVLKDARAIGPLLQALQTTGVGIQPYAAEALGAFQDARIVPALIQSLLSDQPGLRVAAAGALSHFHEPRVVAALAHSLTDESDNVRSKAAESLGNLRDPAAIEPLAQVSKTNPQAVRALGQLNVAASVPPLVAVLQDKRVPFRAQAVESLAHVNDPRVVPALIQAMEQDLATDPSSGFAVQCIQALGRLKDPRAIEPLRKLVGKPTMPSQLAEQALREMGVSPSAQN
jgi:HEAT repeat protein